MRNSWEILAEKAALHRIEFEHPLGFGFGPFVQLELIGETISVKLPSAPFGRQATAEKRSVTRIANEAECC
ncbi:MAG: hypothetical protein R2788_00545 [Saprospiraceae bacterium]